MGVAGRTVRFHGSRLLLALLLAAVVVGAATAALYVDAAPKWISVLLEPLSLLLLPGLAIAMATAGEHDFSSRVVVEASAVFYAVCVYGWLLWRVHGRPPAALRRPSSSR